MRLTSLVAFFLASLSDPVVPLFAHPGDLDAQELYDHIARGMARRLGPVTA